MDELREQMAMLAHEQWSGWMKYLFDKSIAVGAGCGGISAVELPENEKESDRAEADRVLAFLRPSNQSRGLTTACATRSLETTSLDVGEKR